MSTTIESATTNGRLTRRFVKSARKHAPSLRQLLAEVSGTMGLPFFLPFSSNKRRQVEATGGRGRTRKTARSCTKKVRFRNNRHARAKQR